MDARTRVQLLEARLHIETTLLDLQELKVGTVLAELEAARELVNLADAANATSLTPMRKFVAKVA